MGRLMGRLSGSLRDAPRLRVQDAGYDCHRRERRLPRLGCRPKCRPTAWVASGVVVSRGVTKAYVEFCVLGLCLGRRVLHQILRTISDKSSSTNNGASPRTEPNARIPHVQPSGCPPPESVFTDAPKLSRPRSKTATGGWRAARSCQSQGIQTSPLRRHSGGGGIFGRGVGGGGGFFMETDPEHPQCRALGMAASGFERVFSLMQTRKVLGFLQGISRVLGRFG